MYCIVIIYIYSPEDPGEMLRGDPSYIYIYICIYASLCVDRYTHIQHVYNVYIYI